MSLFRRKACIGRGRTKSDLRAHKVLETNPPIHLVGLGRFNRPRLAWPVLGGIARASVVIADGRVL